MFSNCNSKEVKILFRQLCHYLHPDKGGDSMLFDKLINARDLRLKELNKKEDKFEKVYEEKVYKEYVEGEFPKEFEEDKIFKGDPRLKIFDYIFKYQKISKSFKIEFTLSVHNYLLENGFCTSSQYNSLVKMYYSFNMKDRIDKEEELNKEENA